MSGTNSVTLELSPGEAQMLRDVMGVIGGDPVTSRRRYAKSVEQSLEAQGIRSSVHDEAKTKPDDVDWGMSVLYFLPEDGSEDEARDRIFEASQKHSEEGRLAAWMKHDPVELMMASMIFGTDDVDVLARKMLELVRSKIAAGEGNDFPNPPDFPDDTDLEPEEPAFEAGVPFNPCGGF